MPSSHRKKRSALFDKSPKILGGIFEKLLGSYVRRIGGIRHVYQSLDRVPALPSLLIIHTIPTDSFLIFQLYIDTPTAFIHRLTI